MGDQTNETEDRHASREQGREFALRVAEQAENLRGPMLLSGVSAQEAVTAMASALTSAKRDREQLADVAARLERLRPLRDQLAAKLAAENATCDAYANLSRAEMRALLHERDRQLELAWRDLADLRGAQSADPTGAHPYRSAPQAATAAPSSPVVTSDASGRGEGRPGAMRRVYGALASRWPIVALMVFGVLVMAFGALAAVPVLVGFGALLFSPGVAAFACLLFTGDTCV